MLNPTGVRVEVKLPSLVKDGEYNKNHIDSLVILQKLGLTLLASTAEGIEEGFAIYLLPPLWQVSHTNSAYTIIADETGKDIIFAFISKEARNNRPYVFIDRKTGR